MLLDNGPERVLHTTSDQSASTGPELLNPFTIKDNRWY